MVKEIEAGPYKAKILMSVIIGSLSFLLPHNVLAWGGEGGGFGPYGYGGCGVFCGGGGAYYAGQQDAIYDHQQGNSYNPVGVCLPCHSQEYWDNFKQGYDTQWNTYQSQSQSQDQTSSQGASINIYGNNYGTASIGQSTNQGQTATQNPLQQLARVACGIVNCNPTIGPGPQSQLGGYGYGQGYEQGQYPPN